MHIFNCKIKLFEIIDAACKWNSEELQIVCETSLSAHGAQCSELPCKLFLLSEK